ncbi:MAG: hypothetical protein JWR26_276 [Pedosphaera sp.]|nr:hypothetical protein [Pedosphaera sp.]
MQNTKRRRRKQFERAGHDLLKDMDAALEFTGGSFLAASKLLSMTPKNFRNLVNYHDCLKSRWGKSRGWQGGSLPFHVEPFEPAAQPQELNAFTGLDKMKALLSGLLHHEKQQIHDFLSQELRAHTSAPANQPASTVAPGGELISDTWQVAV